MPAQTQGGSIIRKKKKMTREKEIGDQLVVSVTCSHVEVRKTGVMGTSFLSVTASEKAKEGPHGRDCGS